jgi:hypothetical protein
MTSIILWLIFGTIFGMGLRTHGAGGFSWSRFLGATAVKRHVGQMIGIPLTRSGRQRKIGSYLWRW